MEKGKRCGIRSDGGWAFNQLSKGVSRSTALTFLLNGCRFSFPRPAYSISRRRPRNPDNLPFFSSRSPHQHLDFRAIHCYIPTFARETASLARDNLWRVQSFTAMDVCAGARCVCDNLWLRQQAWNDTQDTCKWSNMSYGWGVIRSATCSNSGYPSCLVSQDSIVNFFSITCSYVTTFSNRFTSLQILFVSFDLLARHSLFTLMLISYKCTAHTI